MTSQGEQGWPLGLPPITLRMRLMEAFEAAGAGDTRASFALNASPSFSSLSSSDLDTESTGSFFPDKTITLGSLIGHADTHHPSFPQTSLNNTSGVSTGPSSLIRRLPWWRSNSSGTSSSSTNKLTSSWTDLIRCRSCRGSNNYPDDCSSVGAPPSLGHFLNQEKELDAFSNNQAKVYTNIMFEEDEPGSRKSDAINPLFDLGCVSSRSEISPLSNSLTNSVPAVVNNVDFPDHSISGRANELRRSNHRQQQSFMGLQAASSMPALSKASTSSISRSRRHQRGHSHSKGSCMLSHVSHIWRFSRSPADLKDTHSQSNEVMDFSSNTESMCVSHLESTTPSSRDISCYTDCSFDDSDSSVYFDDEEEESYISNGKIRNINASHNTDESSTQDINSMW